MFLMKKVSSIFVISLVIFSLLLTGCGSSQPSSDSSGQKQIVAKLSHVVSPDTPKGKTLLYFADQVNKNSKGRIKIDIFPSGQLYGDNEEMEAVTANNVQFIAPSSTKIVSLNPAFQIFDVMFLFHSEEAVNKFFKDPQGGQAMLKQLDPKGLVGLGFIPSGFKSWYNSKKPIHTPADMQGVKWRAAAGGVLTQQYAAMGSSSVSIPFGEVYTALQLKTVDGSENSFSNIYTQKFFEVQKYLTISNHGRFDYTVVSNKKFMDSLPADLQKIVRDSMHEAEDYATKIVKDEEKGYMDKTIATGKMEVNTLTPQETEAFVKAVQPVWEKWKTIIGADIFQRAIDSNK